jgi:hypothetical protein
VRFQLRCWAAVTNWGAYESLVFGQEHGDAGVDLADSEGDEHGACGRVCVVLRRRDMMVSLELSQLSLSLHGGPTIHRASFPLRHPRRAHLTSLPSHPSQDATKRWTTSSSQLEETANAYIPIHEAPV